MVFKTVRDRLLFNPRDAITPDDLEQLREAKPEVLALVKVKQALKKGRRLRILELLNETGLEKVRLHGALGELYDWYELGSDYEGYYWLTEPTAN